MIDDTSDGDDILIECYYHIHVTSRIIASSYVQCISMYQTLHIITILTTTTTIYIFMHIIPPNTIYNTILNIHIHIHINIHIQNSTRSSRRKRGPPRLTEIENVQVDETFSLSLPTTEDSQSLSQSLSQLKSQSQSQSKSQSRSRSRSQADSAANATAAAAAGEGCYISTTIHNKRYYGVLISQDSLKEASELHFMEEAKSLNLNRRMVDLRDVHGSVHDNNGDGNGDGNGNDNNGGVGGTMGNTVGENQNQKQGQGQKQRQVQKFKYVDATKKTTGYRVILATYANLEEAASGYGYGNCNGNGNRMLDEIKSACEKVS